MRARLQLVSSFEGNGSTTVYKKGTEALLYTRRGKQSAQAGVRSCHIYIFTCLPYAQRKLRIELTSDDLRVPKRREAKGVDNLISTIVQWM